MDILARDKTQKEVDPHGDEDDLRISQRHGDLKFWRYLGDRGCRFVKNYLRSVKFGP